MHRETLECNYLAGTCTHALPSGQEPDIIQNKLKKKLLTKKMLLYLTEHRIQASSTNQ